MDRCVCKKEFEDGARRVDVDVSINWGDEDERADWNGVESFCSFACLRNWADHQAAKWDGAS